MEVSNKQRDHLHHKTLDFLSLRAPPHSCQNILLEKKQKKTFLWRQEMLLFPKDKLSRVVANYPVIDV